MTKLDVNLLAIGSLLRNRFRIQEIIGRGGYGQIFQAIDEVNHISVAIKAEPTHRKGRRARRMILEQRILLKLQGKPHAPIMLMSGLENNRVNFIVMQLLSKSVGQFRKESPMKRLSKSTCGRILQQSKHRLFLIDYGLARRFRNERGEIRPPRRNIGFRGTLRYASLRVHRREEPGPADDLMSLYYTFIELIRGSVPWRKVGHFNYVKVEKEQLESDGFATVAAGISDSISDIGIMIAALSADEEPNYSVLQELTKDLVGSKSLSDPYDWEEEYVEVMNETDVNRALGIFV